MNQQQFATRFDRGEIWTTSVDGVNLRGRWLENPKPSAPAIHFVHGNGFAGDMYAPSLTELLSQAALFTHDLEGHGLSDVGSEFVGLARSAERICKVLEANSATLGDRPRIGVAHSFGALATLHAAASSPKLFDALVLLDPVILSPKQTVAAQQLYDQGATTNPLATQALERGTDWPDREAAYSYFNGRKSLVDWHSAGLEAYLNGVLQENADGSLSLRCPPWMEAAIFAQRPNDHWQAIDSLAVPCLAIYGEQSMDFIGSNLKLAASRNANISVVGTQGGHCFTHEYPDALREILANSPGTRKWFSAAV